MSVVLPAPRKPVMMVAGIFEIMSVFLVIGLGVLYAD
jgi:hypothetical protein